MREDSANGAPARQRQRTDTAAAVRRRDALELLCARVADADRVGLDTEFHAERTYSPRLMVVQLAFDEGAAIVDALALSDLRSLALALTHTTVVGHALSADLKILADRFDLVPPRAIHAEQGGPTRSVAVIVRSQKLGEGTVLQHRYDRDANTVVEQYGPTQIPYEISSSSAA